MATVLTVLTVLGLLESAAAEPTVAFPFNSQLPPVARISEAYSYTLSRQTFTSESNLTYSLSDAPSWLSIDEETGRLYGTPQDDDVPEGEVVGVPVEIIAEDDDGSTSMSATIVATRNRAPKVNIPLEEQINDFGDQSAPTAIVSYPSSFFSFTFDEDTFSSDAPLDFYATSSDSSPLPSWMHFDSGNLTFSGETPPFENLIQPPQTFDFHLVASDVEGFSATSVAFSVVVGSRKLTIDNPVIELNTTRGSSISHDSLADDIRLDDEPVTPSDLNVTTQDMPDWLSLDEDTLEIEGTPPSDAQSSNATITLRNSLSDKLDIQLQIIIATRIFRKTLSSVEATMSEPFELDLESYFWDPEDVSLEIETEPEQGWLNLDGLVLSGTPPESSSQSRDVKLSLRATVDDSSESETEDVTLQMLSLDESSSTTQSSTADSTSDATETASQSSEAAAQGDSFRDGLNGAQIALAVIIPILVIAILVALFIFLRRRRERRFKKVEIKDISAPIAGSFSQNSSLHSQGPSAVQATKDIPSIPTPPPPTYRPDHKGYLRAALQRIRSTRTTSSLDSDSQHSFTLAPRQLSRSRSLSDNAMAESRNSWLTEEGFVGVRHPTQRSRSSIVSIYESIRDFPSRSRYLRAQTDSTWRNTLDVTIPSMDEDRQATQPATEADGYFDRPKDNRDQGHMDNANANDAPLPSPTAASSDALASIPETMSPSPLGSHPTNGKGVSLGHKDGFKVFRDEAARDPHVAFPPAPGASEGPLARQQSTGSELHARPVSRRSDASPWFGGRSVMPPRTPYPRRYQFDAGSSLTGDRSSMSASASASASGSGGPTGSVDQTPNWRRMSRDSTSAMQETPNWRTIYSQGSAGASSYDESVGESPFYLQSSIAPPRPAKSARRELAGLDGGHFGSGGDESVLKSKPHDKSWMGKGVSLRPRPPRHSRQSRQSRQSGSSASLMSPTKWDVPVERRVSLATEKTREPLAERPVSSIRPVRNSAKSGQELSLGMLVRGGDENKVDERRASKLGQNSSDESSWITDDGQTNGRDDSSSMGMKRGSVSGNGQRPDDDRDKGPGNIGGTGGHGRDMSDESFVVYI